MTEFAPANSNFHYYKTSPALMQTDGELFFKNLVCRADISTLSRILPETFVDRLRVKGTCYRAANWIRADQTRGRTRNDRAHRIQTAVKDVYVYPLVKDFREVLGYDPELGGSVK